MAVLTMAVLALAVLTLAVPLTAYRLLNTLPAGLRQGPDSQQVVASSGLTWCRVHQDPIQRLDARPAQRRRRPGHGLGGHALAHRRRRAELPVRRRLLRGRVPEGPYGEPQVPVRREKRVGSVQRHSTSASASAPAPA
eukprot:scaffold4813_cov77-Phaeocystis_antarctica.AAC.1